jgi:outer membrane murein-binding lipoprotein Lpp
MNVLLWVLQVALAFLYLSGGAYKVFKFDALALETLVLAALYARYSLKLAATNPMVWAAVMGLLVAFVAYGRYALSPLV